MKTMPSNCSVCFLLKKQENNMFPQWFSWFFESVGFSKGDTPKDLKSPTGSKNEENNKNMYGFLVFSLKKQGQPLGNI